MSEGQYLDEPYEEPELGDPDFATGPGVEYVGSTRVEQVIVWEGGRRRLAWACEHGQTAPTPEEAAANCAQYDSEGK